MCVKKHLEIKVTMCQKKITLDGINDRLDMQEKIGKLGHIAIEVMQNETE